MASNDTRTATAEEPDSLAVLPLNVLQQRADFLRAARGVKLACPGFILQARKRQDHETAHGIRVGFTTSKKVGNAVRRNHARRRLREIARLVLPQQGKADFDYVLIGRRDSTAQTDFVALQDQLRAALVKIHGPKKQ